MLRYATIGTGRQVGSPCVVRSGLSWFLQKRQKNHASPSLPHSCKPPSFVRLSLAPPLLHSQGGSQPPFVPLSGGLAVRSATHFAMLRSLQPPSSRLAQGCFSCVFTLSLSKCTLNQPTGTPTGNKMVVLGKQTKNTTKRKAKLGLHWLGQSRSSPSGFATKNLHPTGSIFYCKNLDCPAMQPAEQLSFFSVFFFVEMILSFTSTIENQSNPRVNVY
jgi:hypothetical protein